MTNRAWSLCLSVFFAVAGPALAEEPGFSLEVGASSVHVVVGEPAGKDGKLPLVIYHHGAGRRGLGMYELRALARKFTDAGFRFWAEERDPPVDLDRAVEIGKAMLAHARQDPRVDPERIAVIGFSQGSVEAFAVAINDAHVKLLGILGFGPGKRGGAHLVDRARADGFAKGQARILILNGDADREVDLDAARAVEKELKEAHRDVRSKLYPGLAHEDLCGDKKYLDDLLAFVKEGLQ